MEKLDAKNIQTINELRLKIFRSAHPKSYYDYPDGQDLLGKLLYTNKTSGLVGFVLGCSRCLAYPPIKGFGPKLFVIAKCTVPCLAVASAFTLTTYYATNFRKVDDPLNHVLGGLAAGAIAGSFSQIGHGIMFGILFAGLGYGFKYKKLAGKEIPFKKGVPKMTPGSYYYRHRDLTLSEERKRTWTKELPTETAH